MGLRDDRAHYVALHSDVVRFIPCRHRTSLQVLQSSFVKTAHTVRTTNCQLEVLQQTVMEAIYKPMYGHLLASLPGILNYGGQTDISRLLQDIQFACGVYSQMFGKRTQPRSMLLHDIANVPDPVVRDADARTIQRCTYASAS